MTDQTARIAASRGGFGVRDGVRMLALVLGLAWLPGCPEPPSSPLPDVYLITLDTTRADHLGVYGYERPITPRIDEFARDAIVFDRAWTTSPWTLPSHASMITGKHPTSHGAHYDAFSGEASISDVLGFVPPSSFRANRLGEAETTLAELLSQEGYATAAFAGGHWLAREFGLMQGYDVSLAGAKTLAGRPAPELNEKALAWLNAVPRSDPAHMLINYFDAHDPYLPNAGYRDLAALRNPNPDPEIRALIDAYDGEIKFMDHHVGELIDRLKRMGRYQNALIIMVSDHGELFGEHDQFKHGPWLYEELVRAVMIIRLPGGRGAGTRDARPTSIVDLLPLVAREVGFDLPAGVEGVALGERRLVIAEARPHAIAIRKYGAEINRTLRSGTRWPWKLVTSDRGERSLYRLDRDPGENTAIHDSVEEQPLSAALEAAASKMRPPKRVEPARSTSPETDANLRALGYIE